MNRRKVRKLWIGANGTVNDKRGTGEEVYRHPSLLKPITVNKRKKDAPRELTKALIEIYRGKS